jgi:phosphate-selective porin OprO/OprP
MKKYLPIVFTLIFGFPALAQHIDNPIPYFSSSKGLNITPQDSTFSLNLRFRMQNRFGMSTVSDKDLSTHEWEAVVRRLRLRLDGFVYNPKFTYVIQLIFFKR